MDNSSNPNQKDQKGPDHQPGQIFGVPGSSQPQPQSPPSVPTPEEPKTPHKVGISKWRNWLLAAIAVLILGGGSAFAYFGYYLPNKPENVIGKALQNFLLAESFSFSGQADFSELAGSTSSAEVNGAVDVSTGDLSSFWLDSRVNYSTAVIDAKLIGQDQQLYVNLSGLVDASALLSGLASGQNLEELGVGAAISQLLSSIEDTWFVLDTADLDTPVEQTGISQSDRDKVFDILSSYDLFSIVNEHGEQTINGRQASGYEVKLDLEQLKQALKEVEAADYETLEFDDSLSGNLESGLDDKNTEEVPDYTLNIWVYNADKTLARTNIQISDKQGSASFSLTFDNYNQPVEVQIPEETTPVEELLGSLLAF